MLQHIVIFSWKNGTSSEQVEAFGRALDQLAVTAPGLTRMQHGPDLRFREGNGDYALVASFPDRESWNAYQADPEHQAFIRDHVAPIQAARLAIQIIEGSSA